MTILKDHREDFESSLDKCTKAYEKRDFQECLYAALNCFKIAVKSGEVFKKIAAIRMVKFSAEKLMEEFQSQPVNCEPKLKNEICSLCYKSNENMKFINGVDVHICHECIVTMYDAIHESQET